MSDAMKLVVVGAGAGRMGRRCYVSSGELKVPWFLPPRSSDPVRR